MLNMRVTCRSPQQRSNKYNQRLILRLRDQCITIYSVFTISYRPCYSPPRHPPPSPSASALALLPTLTVPSVCLSHVEGVSGSEVAVDG